MRPRPCSTRTPAHSSSSWTATDGSSTWKRTRACRSSIRYRDGDRHRSRERADQNRCRRAALLQAERGDLLGTLHRMSRERRGSRHVRAVAGNDPRVQRARWTGRPRRHVRSLRVHGSAVLRFDDRKDHRAWPRSPGGDCPHAPRARHDGHRRDQDVGTASPEDSRRGRLPGWALEHRIHGALHAEAEKLQSGGDGLVIRPRLYGILDADVAARAGWRPLDLCRALLEGGARTMQVRAKQLPSGPLLALCEEIVGAATPFGAAIVVNDRPDVARMSAATGVHVGQDDMAPKAVRAIVGPDMIVGWSTHTMEQVAAALSEPVDYIAVGPVFATHTKQTGYDPVGLALIRAAAHRARGIPIVGIGGITLDNARSVLEAGASGVAVISDLLVTGDPRGRTAAYLRALA